MAPQLPETVDISPDRGGFMSYEDEAGASRRDVLRGGALGMGALVGAMGVSGVADAATPSVRMAAAASSAQRFFLAIDGVTGPATAKGFEKQIPVHAYSWGVTNTGGTGGGGGGAGKSTLLPFSFTASSSLASPQLALLAATEKHAVKAVLRGVKSGKTTPYLTITLTTVLVSSLQQTESSGGAPLDTVQLKFAKISYAEGGQTMTA
jgi:type VI secretion system secreted protein Hcp